MNASHLKNCDLYFSVINWEEKKLPKLYYKVVMLLYKGNVCYWWTGEHTVSWKEYKHVLIKHECTFIREYSFCTMMHFGRQRWTRLWLQYCMHQAKVSYSFCSADEYKHSTSGGDSELGIKRYWRMGRVMELEITPNRPRWGTT